LTGRAGPAYAGPMRALATLLCLTLAPAAFAAPTASPDTWLCATGEFGGGDLPTVEIANGSVRVGACPATPAKVKQSRKRTTFRARWAGCDGFRGAVRVTVTLANGSCDAVDVRVRAAKQKTKRRFRAARSKGSPADCEGGDTFAQIERRIFGPRGCRVETCHGSDESGGLDLRHDAAYDALVGVGSVGAPGEPRVAPGDAAASFLVRKLAGVLERGEGDPMPSVGRPLRPLELDLIRAWIDAGAPETGAVPDAPCPPKHRFEEAAPLAPPPGGHQIVFEGPVLQPGEELEGCEWIQAPNAQDFVVGSWEYSLNPGTHHFAVWEHRPEAAMPELGVFDATDTACIRGGARFGLSLSGAPEAPYFVDKYPGGVAKVVKGGSILGINPHYFNEFDVPVQVKLWINLHPAPPSAIVADTLLSLEAALDGKGSFSIFVPPGEVGALRLRYTNPRPGPMTIPQLSSHMHQRGVRFDAWRSDGTPLYENTDWAHPRILNFDPPLSLAPGDWIELQCTHDNGVTREVRRCGDAETDRGCTPGEPMPVTFGITAQDEMCLLTGLVY
jgi:hypothetical protein